MEENRGDTSANIHGEHNVAARHMGRKGERHHHFPQEQKDDTPMPLGVRFADIVGLAAGLVFGVLAITFVFLQNPANIYIYIRICVAFATAPFIFLAAVWSISGEARAHHIASLLFGLLLLGTDFLLSTRAQAHFDMHWVDYSKNVSGVLALWQGLTPYGQRILIGSLAAAISLALVPLLVFPMGFFSAWQYLSDGRTNDSAVLRAFYAFRPTRAGLCCIVLLVTAWLLMNGAVFDIFNLLR